MAHDILFYWKPQNQHGERFQEIPCWISVNGNRRIDGVCMSLSDADADVTSENLLDSDDPVWRGMGRLIRDAAEASPEFREDLSERMGEDAYGHAVDRAYNRTTEAA